MQSTMNAVIYARYSSHSQTEQSIEGQLRDCYAFADREGLHVVGEYIDRAITGRTDDRPDFQRMIADASKKQFQRVIVWKLDRFARNRYDSAHYKAKLKKYGVKVISATENITDEPEGIILEGLLESMAEYYSANLSKHVRRGQRESIINGTYLGGIPPIGYKVENKRLVVDERTAPTIRYMFEQYAQGVSKRQIIDELNARGIRNGKGKPLTLSSMQAALRNEKYIGVYRHGGEVVAGGCEALIDEELFRKVQERLDKVKHAPAATKAKVNYLLQGKAFCGYCGTRMVGESGRGKMGDTYHYYACGKRKRERACNKKNEKKDFIEWYIVEQTVEYVLTPDRIDYIAAALVTQYEKDFGDNRIKDYEKHLERISGEIAALVDTLAVCPASARQPIFDKMELLDVQKSDIEIDLAKLRVASRIQLTEEQIKAWLKRFCNGDPLDMEFRERIIDVFINSVYLYDDKVIIYYNIEGGKQVSYIEMLDSTEEPPFSDDPQGASGVRISNAPPRQYRPGTGFDAKVLKRVSGRL
jgi:site-specific DNA recombinase